MRCPPEVLNLLVMYPSDIFIAGGFIRACVSGEEINDIDIFVSDPAMALSIASILSQKPDRKLIKTGNAITVTGGKYTVQFIHKWVFTSPQKAIESFDFTIAMGALWATKPYPQGTLIQGQYGDVVWESILHPDFYADLASKRLMYTSPTRIEEAGGSMLRVLKFYQKGYRIPLDSLGAVISRLVIGINPDSLPHRPSNHKKGDYTKEEALGKAISNLLIEVDPEVDPNHIAHLPSNEDL